VYEIGYLPFRGCSAEIPGLQRIKDELLSLFTREKYFTVAGGAGSTDRNSGCIYNGIIFQYIDIKVLRKSASETTFQNADYYVIIPPPSHQIHFLHHIIHRSKSKSKYRNSAVSSWKAVGIHVITHPLPPCDPLHRQQKHELELSLCLSLLCRRYSSMTFRAPVQDQEQIA
jgi:hypothetical protein